jgi:hypothetical protein
MFAMYKPLRIFLLMGLALSIAGAIPVLRFLYFWAIGDGAGHVQSLILGGVLLVIGFMTLLIGLVADLISFNRQLLEMVLEKMRRLELEEHRSAAIPDRDTLLRWSRGGERVSSAIDRAP